MANHSLNSILPLIMRLHRQKYPLLLIAAIALFSLLFNNGSPAASNQCQVLNVHDGDTLTLQCRAEKIRVRMYCIDAPETQQKPWGEQARDYLRSLVSTTVRLVSIDKDRYGRVVGEVYNGKTNLNLAQVREGQAAVYKAYCKKPEYPLAEEQAKAAKRGIWSKAGLHQTPWQWRKEKKLSEQ